MVYVNGVALEETLHQFAHLGRFTSGVVPDDHYFVLGDNRNNSQDSRSPLVGYVPRKLIAGQGARALLARSPGRSSRASPALPRRPSDLLRRPSLLGQLQPLSREDRVGIVDLVGLGQPAKGPRIAQQACG